MTSNRSVLPTRVVGGVLLLSLLVVVVVVFAAEWPVSGASYGPNDSAHALALTSAGSSRGAAAGSGTGGSVLPGLGWSPSPTESAAGPTPQPTPGSSPLTLWTPRPFKPSPPPTPALDRFYHVPVLMYHRVVPVAEAGDSMPGLVCPPETFALQMKALFDAGWHSITMATLADDMDTNRTIPPKTFVITFDDGWSDGYTYAFPIMRQYGFVATYYVITSRIDTGQDFLSTPQLQALEAAGNDIGNHTVDHLGLTTLTLDKAYYEVEAASERIATAVGHRPVSLAYPMGAVNDAVALTVSQVPDIKLAVQSSPGTYETWFKRYAIPRVRINPGTTPDQLLAWVNM